MRDKVFNDFAQVFTVIPDSQTKVKSSSYLISGKYAVVDQGKDLIAGYTDTDPTVNEDSLPVIVFGDHTRAVKYVDFPFAAGADGTQILKPSPLTIPKYAFYSVLHAVSQIPSKGYARHFGNLKKMPFPLPSLEKQREIVEKLDCAFDEMDVLQKNLDMSEENANQLAQSILNSEFRKSEQSGESDYPSARGGPAMSLESLTSIQTGKIDVNKAVVGGKYPFFTCSRDVYEINEAPFEGKAVLVAGNGDLNVKYYEGKFNAYQRTYFLFVNDEHELIPRYLYWFLESYVSRLRSESIGSTIKYIKMGNLSKAEIPLPSLEEQREIIQKLDSAFAEIDLVIEKIRIKREINSQLKQSLLHQALNNHGEVA